MEKVIYPPLGQSPLDLEPLAPSGSKETQKTSLWRVRGCEGAHSKKKKSSSREIVRKTSVLHGTFIFQTRSIDARKARQRSRGSKATPPPLERTERCRQPHSDPSVSSLSLCFLISVIHISFSLAAPSSTSPYSIDTHYHRGLNASFLLYRQLTRAYTI